VVLPVAMNVYCQEDNHPNLPQLPIDFQVKIFFIKQSPDFNFTLLYISSNERIFTSKK